MKLITGRYYWMKHDGHWRPCYVGQDPDDNQWLHVLGWGEALEVEKMQLDAFEWRELECPK